MFLKELRPYQVEAFERAAPLEGFGLFGEQRTGKTPIAAKLIDHHKPDRLLVITVPKGVVVWAKEFNESLVFDWPCERMILHYAELRNPKKRRMLYKWLSEGERSMTIADEAHAIKRRGSKQGRCVRNCGKRSAFRLALTGTPIAQGIWDAWALFNFIHPLAFGKFERFAKKFLEFHPKWKSKPIGHDEEMLPTFNKIFHRYSHRVTLREARARAGLPGLKVRTSIVPITLDKNTRSVYDSLEKEMMAIIPRRGKPDRVTAGLVITQVMKMQQVTGGFVIADSGKIRKVGNDKLIALDAVFEEVGVDKAVVVCRFLHEIRAIKRRLELEGKVVQVIAGGTEWTGTLTADVAILQIQSGSAIDLSSANSIIFYSWDYSYINHEQTKFRILSYDKARVDYFWLRAIDSIDELIYDRVTSKEDLANRVCDHYRKRR
jgi:hypothetical protein